MHTTCFEARQRQHTSLTPATDEDRAEPAREKQKHMSRLACLVMCLNRIVCATGSSRLISACSRRTKVEEAREDVVRENKAPRPPSGTDGHAQRMRAWGPVRPQLSDFNRGIPARSRRDPRCSHSPHRCTISQQCGTQTGWHTHTHAHQSCGAPLQSMRHRQELHRRLAELESGPEAR